MFFYRKYLIFLFIQIVMASTAIAESSASGICQSPSDSKGERMQCFCNGAKDSLNGGDMEISYVLADSCLKLAVELDDSVFIARALNSKGDVHLKRLEWEQCYEFLFQALAIRERNGWHGEKARSYQSLANAFAGKGDLVEKSGQPEAAVKDYELAQEYYLYAYEAARLSRDQEAIFEAYFGVAVSYYYLLDYKTAIDTIESLIDKIGRNEESDLLNDVKILEQTCLNYLYDDAENPGELRHLRRDFLQRGNLRALLITDINLAATFETDSIEVAIEYLLEADSIAAMVGEKFHRYSIQSNLGNRYDILKDYQKAYFHLRHAMDLKNYVDSINSEEKIREYEQRYKAAKKDKEIAERKAEIRTLLIVLSVSVLLIIIFVIRYNTLKALRHKDNELHGQEVNNLLKERELIALNNFLKGQGKERKRLSIELHDRMGSVLSALRNQIESAFETVLNGGSHEKQDKINNLIDTAIDETRDMAHSLGSAILDKFGLQKALEDLVGSIEGSSLAVSLEWNVETTDRLSGEVEIQIYRILQEIINNVLRHAQATKLRIELNEEGEELKVVVTDNGIGFDTRKRSNGIGLQNIDIRLRDIHGKIAISSRPTRGTRTTLQIPLYETTENPIG